MTRYGVDIYGQCTYGVEGTSTNLIWGLDIAWEAEGVYTGTNYAQYMTSCEWTRGRSKYLGNNGKGIELPEIGQLTFDLDNRTGIFDVTNTGSSLYPNVEPGKYARLRVRIGESGTAYNVFSGIISNIEPVWGGINPAVKVTVEDGWRLLNDTEVNLEYAADCTSSVAVASILNAVNYPALWGTSIETGNYKIPHLMAVKDKRASEVLKDVINFEFGRVAVANDGKFKFKKQTQSSSPLFTISQSQMLKDVQVTQSYNSIRNAAKMILYPKWWFGGNDSTGPTPKVLWTLDETPLVASHDIYTVWGEFQYADHDAIATSLQPLAAGTDYTANSKEDGSGTDRTGQLQITVTPYANRAKFDIYNAGTNDAYVTLLQIQGLGYYSPDSTFVEVDNSTTTKRVVEIDSPYIQTRSHAKNQGTHLLSVLAHEVLPRFQMESQPERQFEYDLLDEVTLSIPKYDINGSYFISHIEGKWLTENGQAVLTTYQVETAAEGGIA